MSDISIRRGVLAVLRDLREASGLEDRELEKVFAAGGGPPAVIGPRRRGPPARPGDDPALPCEGPAGTRTRGPRDDRQRTSWRTSRSSSTSDRETGPPGGRPASPAERLAGMLRLVHPFPSFLDAVVAACVASVAGAELPRALQLGLSMLLLQFAIGAANDWADAPTDARAQPWKPIPSGVVTRERAVAHRGRGGGRRAGPGGGHRAGAARRRGGRAGGRPGLRPASEAKPVVLGGLCGGSPAAARLRVGRFRAGRSRPTPLSSWRCRRSRAPPCRSRTPSETSRGTASPGS